MRRTLAPAAATLALAVLAFAAGPAYAARPVTGRVTSEETGAARPGVTVGATRLSVAESVAPDAPIPVEWTVVTNAQGDYRFDLDETQAGMDRLLVFTFHHLVLNGAVRRGRRFRDRAAPR